MTHPAHLRVGIVGVGSIARGAHIPGYLLCDNVEIAALCDTSETALTTIGAELGVARLTSDYQELVNLADLDIVDVCTYPNTHHPVTMAAIAAGKHVFCEKPLALTHPLARETRPAAPHRGEPRPERRGSASHGEF